MYTYIHVRSLKTTNIIYFRRCDTAWDSCSYCHINIYLKKEICVIVTIIIITMMMYLFYKMIVSSKWKEKHTMYSHLACVFWANHGRPYRGDRGRSEIAIQQDDVTNEKGSVCASHPHIWPMMMGVVLCAMVPQHFHVLHILLSIVTCYYNTVSIYIKYSY